MTLSLEVKIQSIVVSGDDGFYWGGEYHPGGGWRAAFSTAQDSLKWGEIRNWDGDTLCHGKTWQKEDISNLLASFIRGEKVKFKKGSLRLGPASKRAAKIEVQL